jgi:hypothetical protein
LIVLLTIKRSSNFSTYEIENSGEAVDATQNNGLLEVFFYKEDVITLDNWQRKFDRIIVEKYYPYNPYPWYNPYTVWYGTTSPTIGGSCVTTNLNNSIVGTTTTSNAYYSSNNVNFSNTSNSVNLSNLNIAGSNMTPINSIETGRVEKGEVSKQKFTEVDMDFEKHYIASTIIQILPESRKPAEVKDVKKVKQESDDVIELIKKLADLHSAGILTDDEFSEKKSELLSKI